MARTIARRPFMGEGVDSPYLCRISEAGCIAVVRALPPAPAWSFVGSSNAMHLSGGVRPGLEQAEQAARIVCGGGQAGGNCVPRAGGWVGLGFFTRRDGRASNAFTRSNVPHSDLWLRRGSAICSAVRCVPYYVGGHNRHIARWLTREQTAGKPQPNRRPNRSHSAAFRANPTATCRSVFVHPSICPTRTSPRSISPASARPALLIEVLLSSPCLDARRGR